MTKPFFNRCLSFALLVIVLLTRSLSAQGITRSPHLPATTPWDLAKLSETPSMEWVDDKAPVRSLFYAGESYGGKPTRVFAYYASPSTLDPQSGTSKGNAEKKFPAMVLIHGGGGTAFREWAELWAKRGYAAIAMDTAGHQPHEGKNAHQVANRTRLIDGGPNQGDEEKFGSVDKAPGEQWTFHAVAAAIRAHSLIRSFPEVDASRTGVTGISWGGYLTCIVASVDNRFKAAVPVYGCGYLHDNSVWLPRFAKMTAEQRDRWVSLWDPSRYLPAFSMPILFVNGTNDFAYPLDSYMKCYGLVPSEKQIRVTVNMPHGHPQGWAPAEIGLFIDQHLRGGEPLPRLTKPEVKQGHVQFACSNSAKLKAAAIHYTTDTGPINKRTWKTVAAKLENQSATVDAAPADATIWFVTATDTRDAIVSSEVIIQKAN